MLRKSILVVLTRFQRDKSALLRRSLDEGEFRLPKLLRSRLMYFVYLLKCIDNRTYIGSTNDLKDRIKRHQLGYIHATKLRLPIKLIAYFAFNNESIARNFEQYLKSGSGRAFMKKHNLINYQSRSYPRTVPIRIMPRQLVTGRLIAHGRRIAIGRKPVGFINDGKIHVVIDTNVIIDALEAIVKGNSASQKEKDCLTIIDCWGKDKFSVGINHYLYKEYSQVIQKKVNDKKVKPEDVSWVMNLTQKCFAVRVLVDQMKISNDLGDDMLFDGLCADYLVTSNLKDVAPSRLKSQSTYKKTLSPNMFVEELKILSLM